MLVAAFRTFTQVLERLNERGEAVYDVLSRFKPDDDLALTEVMADACTDLLGVIRQAREAAEAASAAVASPTAVPRSHPALARAHERLLQLRARAESELWAYERLHEVATVGHGRAPERRAEWQGWSRVVRRLLVQFQSALGEADEAALACWQELCEHLAERGPSINATNIGQKIELAQPSELERT
jgi:uncharacterized membrane protein